MKNTSERILRLAKLGLQARGHDLGDAYLDLDLKTHRALDAELGALDPEIKEAGKWPKNWQGSWPAERKVAAFVQWLCQQRSCGSALKVDGVAGPMTLEAARTLEIVMTLPAMLLFAQQVLRSDLRTEREVVECWCEPGGGNDLEDLLGELPNTSDALEAAARQEWLPRDWTVRKQLVGFTQLLCRQAGFKEVGEIDGEIGWRSLTAFDALSRRFARGPKIGLALSGGGFRSAIFHLGVIRRLEELGLMPQVRVISAVSGGSVIAAYYLIEMERRLRARWPDPADGPRQAAASLQQCQQDLLRAEVDLRRTPDLAAAQENLRRAQESLCLAQEAQERLRGVRVEIFEEIARDFFHATDRNLRVRALVFAPFYHPIAALRLLAPGYSRADLIQQEYDRWFYEGNSLDQLPCVAADDRTAATGGSGPKLVINTTSLLSGRRVAFSRESISGIEELSQVDTNVLPLSRIVGASAGVPGLFPPTPVGGDLLVDGGVSDNQGMEALWKEGCDVLLVSDASGQMEQLHKLKPKAMAVLGRANSIFQSGLRCQLIRRLLQWRGESPSLREFAFVHLHQNLKGDPKARLRVPSEYVGPLARMRTDLDQFSQVEREALMFHGYTLIDSQLKRHCPRLMNLAAAAGIGQLSVSPLFARSRPTGARGSGEGVEAASEEATEQRRQEELGRRSEIKKILEAGRHSPLILRSMAREGAKAGVVVALAWLLPVALFLRFGFPRLHGFLFQRLEKVSDLSPLTDWLAGLLPAAASGPLAALAHHLRWPISFEGLLAVLLFAASTYVLLFITYSAIRWLSAKWDRRTYGRLTGTDPDDPMQARWERPAAAGSLLESVPSAAEPEAKARG